MAIPQGGYSRRWNRVEHRRYPVGGGEGVVGLQGNRLLGVVVLAVAFALAWRDTEQLALTITTPVGARHGTLHVRHTEDGWEGEATSDDQTMPLSNLVRDGNHMTWTRQLIRTIRLMLKFDVTIIGERMTGKVRTGLLLASNVSGTRTS
jgi:hypothetical protein